MFRKKSQVSQEISTQENITIKNGDSHKYRNCGTHKDCQVSLPVATFNDTAKVDVNLLFGELSHGVVNL